MEDPTSPEMSPTDWIKRNCYIIQPGQGRQLLRPYPYQVRLWEDTGRQRIILKSRQMGISRALACEALYWAINRPGSTVLFVSRSLQAARNLLRYAKQSLSPAIASDKTLRPTRQNNTSMEWDDRESQIVSLAASVDAARSYSATDVYLDEAAHLPWAEEIYQSLAPTVSGGGRMTVLSTPYGRGNLFHRLWEDSLLLPSWNCHRIHWSERPEYTHEWAEAERLRHTTRSWAEEYDLSFEESGKNVFTEEVISHLITTEPFLSYTPTPPFFAGLDLARYSDYTVLMVVDSSGMVMDLKRFNKATWQIQLDRVVRALRRWKDCTVLCDVSGIGDVIFELFQLHAAAPENHFRCTGFKYTTESRAVLMDEFVLAVENEKLKIPAPLEGEDRWDGIDPLVGGGDPSSRPPQTRALLAELRSFQWDETPGGRAKPSHPEGGHDDCVQALALAYRLLKEHQKPKLPAMPALIATGSFVSPLQGRRGGVEDAPFSATEERW